MNLDSYICQGYRILFKITQLEMSDKSKKPSDLAGLLEILSMNNSDIEPSDAKVNDHEFWNTQPVPQNCIFFRLFLMIFLNFVADDLYKDFEDGPIDSVDSLDKISQIPLPLPSGYEFTSFNIEDSSELSELYDLLCLNYVEDYDCLFRFDYSREFLQWALKPPGWKSDWHVAVRSKIENNSISSKGRLVAFIAAVPCGLKIRKNSFRSVEVNFLCIEKSLRTKRIAPLLIREVTRRVNLTGIFQALYTAGISLPEPIAVSQYYHRPLNFKKLLDSGFTYLSPGKSVTQMSAYYKLPSSSNFKIRPVVAADIPQVSQMLRNYLNKFFLAHEMDENECSHWLLPRENVLHSFVIIDPDTDEIIDFFSFYSIPSTVLNNPKYKTIEVAYLFYYSISSEIRILPVIKAALIEASNLGFDVLNCLNLMENDKTILECLKFGPGDGHLRFYLYNWKTKPIKSSQIGFIML